MAEPLTELEMFDLLRLAYPEKFADDEDETWEKAMAFADQLEGFDELADLLGRVVMLTSPISSPLTWEVFHALGAVSVKDGKSTLVAAVKRPVKEEKENESNKL